MAPLVARIISVLKDATSEVDVEKAMLNAALLFEKARGLAPCAWPEDVVGCEMSGADINCLEEAVVAFVEKRGLGSWTLGKRHNASLKPVFVRVLQNQVHGNPDELFEAMIALDALGEPIFQSRPSRSPLNISVNRSLALEYLRGLTSSSA